jgi:putative chitinase
MKNPELLAQAFNDTCLKYNINTQLRKQHFLAQIIHESAGFKYSQEIASGAAYEGRKDLGNTFAGAGRRFKGRGFIQITGYFNYKEITTDFKIDFINKPELLCQLPYSMLSSGWFWNKRNLSVYADKDDIFQVSARINGINRTTGEPNHLYERKSWLNFCKKNLKDL